MSPTYFAVRNARLEEELEAARLAGDLQRIKDCSLKRPSC